VSTFGVNVATGDFSLTCWRVTGATRFCACSRAGSQDHCLTPEESKFGSVEDVCRRAALRRSFPLACDEIDVVIVSLPNFGDERAIADTLRLARLNVPVAGTSHSRCAGE